MPRVRELPFDPTGKRILVTNDDGVDAGGIEVLEGIARQFTDDVWVVAPKTEQSGTGHSLTIHRPLRLEQLAERRFCVDGTPTDCVMIAVGHLLFDNPPDLVLSGVNNGENIAEDVTYSGTVSAAMEATLLGIPAIAFSMQRHKVEPRMPWDTASHFAPDIVRTLTSVEWSEDLLMSVNFPHLSVEEVKGVKVVPHGRRKQGDDLVERKDPRGRSYFWIGALSHRAMEDIATGTDIEALDQGWITVTPIHMDMTHYPTLEALKSKF